MRDEYKAELESFQHEGDEDCIGLWQVIAIVNRILGLKTFSLSAPDSNKSLQATMEFVQLMLRNGFVAVDMEGQGGYKAWPDQDPTIVTQRIKNEWIRLKGAQPDIGFIVWFNKVDKAP